MLGKLVATSEKIPSSQQSMSLTGNVLLFYLSCIHLGHACVCHYRARKSGSKRAREKARGRLILDPASSFDK